jgi:prolyl oligopeptidase
MSTSIKKRTWEYPEARRDDVVDDYHGTPVADPYRWLEDPASDETRRWVEAQNRLTRSYIDAFPGRPRLHERLTELWNYPKYGLPLKHGGRYFYSRNDGLQNQAVVYRADSLEGEPQVLLDPNGLSDDGTAALTNEAYSDDGTLLAYGISLHGSDRQEIRIRDVDSGEDYDDIICWARFAGIAWRKDNSGFFYNRFPEPDTVPKEDENNFAQIYWHRLDTPQSDDELVFEMPERKEQGFFPFMTEDGAWLGVFSYVGTDPRNGFYVRPADDDGEFQCVVDVEEAMFRPVGNIGSVFYVHTDLDAPRGRVVAIDVTRPERENWREILPQQDDVINGVAIIADHLVVQFMHNAHELVRLHDLEGTPLQDLELPTMGSIGGISGRQKDDEMFFLFTSFVYPSVIYRYDFATGKSRPLRESQIRFDGSAYETRQVFYTSQDGTRVSMFLTHRKGLEPDGDHPTLLYGYGGFNIPLTPAFSVSRLLWLEAGGIYAVANLRGGSEYGEEWHRDGMLEKKQNVFDDFIAAGEWLVEQGYTRPERLAINGGSNGGLLVTACLLQRPDLFGAAVAQVPVTDMLRYHRWTVGRYWVPEYGNAETDAELFPILHGYSPLHNVKEGVAYPSTLLATADTDDRVVPAHAKKFAATLQRADAGQNPILLRVETKAGHGAGKPTTKLIDEAVDIHAFLFQTLGVRS